MLWKVPAERFLVLNLSLFHEFDDELKICILMDIHVMNDFSKMQQLFQGK